MIGQRLKAYRKKKGLKSKELANIIGISQGSLSGLETGKSDPSSDTLLNLIRNTDINLAWLLTGEGPMDATNVLISGQNYQILDDITVQIVERLLNSTEDMRWRILKAMTPDETPVVDLTSRSPAWHLQRQFDRIMAEGDKKKIEGLKGMLAALDPGESPSEGVGEGENEGAGAKSDCA